MTSKLVTNRRSSGIHAHHRDRHHETRLTVDNETENRLKTAEIDLADQEEQPFLNQSQNNEKKPKYSSPKRLSLRQLQASLNRNTCVQSCQYSTVATIAAIIICIVLIIAFIGIKYGKQTHAFKHNPIVSYFNPTDPPTNIPTLEPTQEPTHEPTKTPTATPTDSPTQQPTKTPTYAGISESVTPVMLDDYENALCLDGSFGMYYISKTEDSEMSNKYVIYFEGGSWCAGFNETMFQSSSDFLDTANETSNTGLGEKKPGFFETCLERSRSDLGSTTFDHKFVIRVQRDAQGRTHGVSQLKDNIKMKFGYGAGLSYFVRDPTVNPLFWNWNIVFVRYCDGTSYTSNLREPVRVLETVFDSDESLDTNDLEVGWHNDTSASEAPVEGEIERSRTFNSKLLYFKGFGILNAVFTDLLEKRGLKTAEDIIIAGENSAAFGLYLHSEYITNKFINHENIKPLNSLLFLLDNGYILQQQIADISDLQQNMEKNENIASEIEPINTDGSNVSYSHNDTVSSVSTKKPDRGGLTQAGRFEYTRFLTKQRVEASDSNGMGLGFDELMRWIYVSTNASGLSESCLEQNVNDGINCMYPEHNLRYMCGIFETFIIQRKFDYFQTCNIFGICDKTDENFASLMDQYGTRLVDSIMANRLNETGLFLDSCYSEDGLNVMFNQIHIRNDTQSSALEKFWHYSFDFIRRNVFDNETESGLDEEYMWLQSEPFNCDHCCD